MPLTLERNFAPTSEHKCRIETAVREKLTRSKYRGIRRVSCKFEGEVLKLSGTVSTYYEKQIAQSLVLPLLIPNVHFENQLEVIAACRE